MLRVWNCGIFAKNFLENYPRKFLSLFPLPAVRWCEYTPSYTRIVAHINSDMLRTRRHRRIFTMRPSVTQPDSIHTNLYIAQYSNPYERKKSGKNFEIWNEKLFTSFSPRKIFSTYWIWKKKMLLVNSTNVKIFMKKFPYNFLFQISKFFPYVFDFVQWTHSTLTLNITYLLHF